MSGGFVHFVLDPWFVLGKSTIAITELAVLENFGVIEAGDALVGKYDHKSIGGEVVVWPLRHYIDFDLDGSCLDLLWIAPRVLNRVDAVMDGGEARDVGGMMTAMVVGKGSMMVISAIAAQASSKLS